jgi:hypothetical protein
MLSDLRATIKSHGVWVFVLRCARLASCLALVGISIAAFLVQDDSERTTGLLYYINFKKGGKKNRQRALQRAEWIELIQTAFYVRVYPTM